MANQGRQIAIFADPVLSRDDARIDTAASRTGQFGRRPLFAELPRLTGSMKEARAIARLGHGDSILVKSGFDANLEQVRSLSSRDISVLHFATHTVNIPGHPELSGIALSMFAPNGEERDGILWLKDIESLRLPLSMVVLSGCETDQEAGDSGEAVNSLAYAFFLSGVHSIVASLWNVDYRTTSRLMENFYRNLLSRHLRTDDALRAAQLEMLSHPQTSFPAIWASFVSEGSPVGYAPDTVVLSQRAVHADVLEPRNDKSVAHVSR
jgi:CHAT domain-containing protein